MEETYSRAGGREAAFGSIHGEREGSGGVSGQQAWAERCNTHPSRGRNGEWAQERKPRRKTD